MKNFLKENWFKLMTGTSMLMFSFAFLLYAVSPSYANYTKEEAPSKCDYALVPVNEDGSINVRVTGDVVDVKIEEVDQWAFQWCTVPVEVQN